LCLEKECLGSAGRPRAGWPRRLTCPCRNAGFADGIRLAVLDVEASMARTTASTQRRFKGKSIVVTGASSGIGAAVARAFAREGARVALIARRADRLERIAAEIRQDGGEAFPFPADLARVEEVPALLSQILAGLGAVDVLVNAAGLNRRGPIDRWEPKQLGDIITLNLTVPVILTRLVLPHMKGRGSGAVVNVASLAGRVPLRGEAVYSATKFAVRAFSSALAEEVASANVHVSVVSPGPVDSEFVRRDIDSISDVVFAQPMTSPEHVAAMILTCALDGRAERATPRSSAFSATVAYLFPWLRRALSRLMRARGARAKERYLRSQDSRASG